MSARLIDPQRVSLHQLRRAVRGQETLLPRGPAMALLQASLFPQRHLDYALVLQNREEAPALRALAAQHLGRVGTPAALAVLMQQGSTEPERVQRAVVMALGRTGGEDALEVVRRAGTGGSPRLAAEARFAEALITHRLGLEEGGDPSPENLELLALPTGFALAVPVRLAPPATVTRCVATLVSEPYGIEYAEEGAVQLRMDSEEWVVLLNRDLASPNGAETLYRRKTLLGVIAERDVLDDAYSVALLLLATPEKGAVRLSLHRPDGDLIYLGRLEGGAFTIRTVDRPDALPLELCGRLGDGRLDVETAHTAIMTTPKKRPLPLISARKPPPL